MKDVERRRGQETYLSEERKRDPKNEATSSPPPSSFVPVAAAFALSPLICCVYVCDILPFVLTETLKEEKKHSRPSLCLVGVLVACLFPSKQEKRVVDVILPAYERHAPFRGAHT